MATVIHIIDKNLPVYATGNQIISGVKTFASRPTVNGTGFLLSGEAENITLPNTIVYTTGDQLISGDKTFLNNIAVSGTGNFNNVKVSNIDKLFLSGIDIVITGNSSINVYNTIYISGNSVLTGAIPSSQTITDVVYATGNQIISGNKIFINNIGVSGTGNFNNIKVSSIDNLFLSGIDIVVTGNSSINVNNPIYISGNAVLTGINLASYATTSNLAITGSILDQKINSLSGSSVLIFGNQNIFGTKSFISNTFFDKDITVTGNIRGSGAAFFNGNLNVVNTLNVSGNLNIGGSLSAPNVVLTRNRQTISGVKTFVDDMSLNAYTGNGYDDTNLDYRLNIGGDVNENVGIQIDAYGINPPQILMRRARGIPTGLSGVLRDDVLFNLQARGYVSGLNNYSTNSRAAIRLIAAEDWVGRDGYTGQGTYILFRSTNIGAGTAIDKVVISTSGINVLDGNIFINGYPVVNTTSNQTISGSKTFFDSGIFSNGGTPAVPLLNNPLSIVGSGNNYLQVNIQNRASGKFASADLVITANNGTDNTNYINLGINNSGYSDPEFTNGSGLDGYLYIDGGNLDIGTKTPGKIIEFHAGGVSQNSTIARIDSSGINILSGTYRVNNVPSNTFTINFLSSNANLSAGANYISNVGAGYSPTFSDRSIPMFEPCAARKASISLLNSGPGTNLVGVTGYFINTSTNPPQTGIINSAITALVGSNQYTYTGAFANPINISHGDNVVCAIFSTGTTTNVRTAASIYCYN